MNRQSYLKQQHAAASHATVITKINVVAGSLRSFLETMTTALRCARASFQIGLVLNMMRGMNGMFSSPIFTLSADGKDRGGTLRIMGIQPAPRRIRIIGKDQPSEARVFITVPKKGGGSYMLVVFLERAVGSEQWMVEGIAAGNNESVEFYQAVEAWAKTNNVLFVRKSVEMITTALNAKDGKFADED